MNKLPKELAQLEALICKAANVLAEDIYANDRSKDIVNARHAIWLIAHKNLGYSYQSLSRVYKKDRTTIMHGIARMLYTDAHKILERKLKIVCPELVIPLQKGEPKSIKNWDFEPVD